MRYQSKRQFIAAIDEQWRVLCDLLDQAPDAAMIQPGLWGGDRSAKDVLMHLHEWHLMNLRWYRDGLRGTPVMPAEGYTWLECPALNRAIFEKHRDVSLPRARKALAASHAEIRGLAASLSGDALLQPGHFTWCGMAGKLPLTSYLHANTAGHYKWAQRKIKALLKNTAARPPAKSAPRK